MIEECNRIITDHLSTLLFCPTKAALKNLTKEGLDKRAIFSGDVMYDSFLKFKSSKKKFDSQSTSSKYILATIHRRENISSRPKLLAIFESLNFINKYKKIVMPLHPHTKNKLDEFQIESKIEFIKPVDYHAMLSLLINCEMVITDSGGLQKESYFAKKKCIILRNETEWIDLLKNGASVLSSAANIYDCYKNLNEKKLDFSSSLFGNGSASQSIVESISSHF